MTNTLQRIRVVAGSVVTWLTVIGAVVAILVAELSAFVDVHPAVDQVVAVLLVAASVIGTATLILRRVMAVELVAAPPSQIGILPPPVYDPGELPRLPPR